MRIVIRPAPKRRTQSSQLWPMPPGHRGQTYSFFVEETTTGETTPQDPGEWSIASERGSVKDGFDGSTTNNTRVYDLVQASGFGLGAIVEPDEFESGSRPSMSTSGGGGMSTVWERETTSQGGRSDGSSYPGLGTLLTPPPAWHERAAASGWPSQLAPTPADSSNIGTNEAERGSGTRSGTRSGTDWSSSDGGGAQVSPLRLGKAR